MAIRHTWRYWLDFVTVPLAAVACMLHAQGVAPIVFGYIAWVLVEYWMHRWLFHRVLRQAHWVHHVRPHDQSGQVSSFHSGTVIVLLLFFVGVNGLTAGFLLGYLSYIVAHHLSHAGWFKYQPAWLLRHELHHREAKANYNVLCPLGDLLFGTYRSASKR